MAKPDKPAFINPVGKDDLYIFLRNECGSRCMDDEADTEAVVKAMMEKFVIIKKEDIKW